MRATGISADEYRRILNQLTQTMAKGKFQGEELTALAENAVPAYQKLAAAMGVTTTRLTEMLQAGTVSSDNMLLLANELHKDYAALAEAASSSIPAQFTRGFNTIFNEFVALTKGVLASSEAIKAIEFESNMLDIFPDPSVISQTTNNIIRIVVTIAELTSVVFQKVKDVIIGTFQDIASFLGKMLPDLSSFFDKFASWSTKLGQALGFVSKDIDTVSLSTDDLQKSILDIASVKGVGDVMAPFTGSEGKALVQDVRHLADEVANLFGTEMPPIVDPKKQTDSAKKTAKEVPPVVQKFIDEIEAKVGPSLLVDPEKEKKAAQELVQQAKEASDAVEDIRKKLEEETRKEAEKTHDAFLQILDRTNKERIAATKKVEEETREEAEKTHDEFLKILDRTNKERIAESEKANAVIAKSFENMAENIQEALANSIHDAITGDLDSIEDFADTLADLFTETAATISSELLAAFAMEGIMDKVTTGLTKLVGWAKQKIDELGRQLGIGGLGGQAGEMAGGIFTGIGVGMAANQMAGVNNTGGMIGNIVGGVVGGIVGAFTAVGPVIGAAAGSVIGGMLGGILSEHEEKVRLIFQTSLGAPTAPHEGPTSRGPFGIISLFDQSVVSAEVASSAALAISEIDAGIAKYLNTQQRALVQDYFLTAVPEASTVQAEEMDDAIAKAIQLRLFHALTALTDQATATNIVGEPFSATAGNIQAITDRAMEALAILEMIEDFKIGPLTATATAIQNISEQFQALADRASMLNIPVEEIFAERDRLIAQVTTDFNEGIANGLLAIMDPVAAEFAALEAMQQERYHNAVDAGANLVEVERLNAAERLELEKRINEEIQAQSDAARGNIVGLILGMTDPFAAAMHSIHQQLLIFRAQVAEGILPQELVDQWYRDASAAAQKAEDERKKAEADAIRRFNEEVANDILELTDPIAAQWDDLLRRQRDEREEAIARGADLAALERKHALEQADLERRLAEEGANTAIAASEQVNEAVVRGAEDTSNSIINGNNLVNDSIVSGAQNAASIASGAFANAANAAASILASIRGQAEATAAATARIVNASVQRPSIPRASTGGASSPQVERDRRSRQVGLDMVVPAGSQREMYR